MEKFNDMPRRFHANVNVDEAPYDRKRGDKPALSEREIDDLVSFLGTLNDGYTGQR